MQRWEYQTKTRVPLHLSIRPFTNSCFTDWQPEKKHVLWYDLGCYFSFLVWSKLWFKIDKWWYIVKNNEPYEDLPEEDMKTYDKGEWNHKVYWNNILPLFLSVRLFWSFPKALFGITFWTHQNRNQNSYLFKSWKIFSSYIWMCPCHPSF